MVETIIDWIWSRCRLEHDKSWEGYEYDEAVYSLREAIKSGATKAPITIGDIAVCAQGKVGLITSMSNHGGMLYKGIQLGKTNLGRPWQSSRPIKVENIHGLLNQE